MFIVHLACALNFSATTSRKESSTWRIATVFFTTYRRLNGWPKSHVFMSLCVQELYFRFGKTIRGTLARAMS